MLTGNSSASKRLITSTPLTPATRLDQVDGASLPTGVTAPSPVITARRTWSQSSGRGTVHVARRLRPFCGWLISEPRLTVADHDVLRCGQLFQAEWAARVKPAGRDADLGTHTVDGAVGEAGGRIDVHSRGVDLTREPFGSHVVLGHDRLGVAGSVAGDVVERLIEVIHDPQRDLEVEELGRPGLLALQHLDPLRLQRLDQRRHQPRAVPGDAPRLAGRS